MSYLLLMRFVYGNFVGQVDLWGTELNFFMLKIWLLLQSGARSPLAAFDSSHPRLSRH